MLGLRKSDKHHKILVITEVLTEGKIRHVEGKTMTFINAKPVGNYSFAM